MIPAAYALVDPKRSAHATLRGYLYQACLGVVRWLDLKNGEALLCEGDPEEPNGTSLPCIHFLQPRR